MKSSLQATSVSALPSEVYTAMVVSKLEPAVASVTGLPVPSTLYQSVYVKGAHDPSTSGSFAAPPFCWFSRVPGEIAMAPANVSLDGTGPPTFKPPLLTQRLRLKVEKTQPSRSNCAPDDVVSDPLTA